MLIRNKSSLDNLLADLNGFIRRNKAELFEMNRKITLDTDYWIEDDYKTINAYLSGYVKNHYSIKLVDRVKPKGKILIILSYNEPFILSIIPLLNALIIGNEVILKINQKNEKFVKMIWLKSGFIDKYKLNLKIIFKKTHSEVTDIIKTVKAVYFFGSYQVAQNISKICGEYYVEFYPEIETADLKIFNNNQASIRRDAILTLQESFSHSGQTCQRIQGILVQEKIYDRYLEILKQEFIKLCQSENLNKFVNIKYALARKDKVNMLLLDIDKSKPDIIINTKNLPLLVINPNKNSDFVKNAYFLPVLWISSFSSKENLVKILNLRKFFLGINIQSNNYRFIDYIISNTRFTRYTINTSHTNIRPQEGWGGAWPSGLLGYRSWIEYFSDGYVRLDKPR